MQAVRPELRAGKTLSETNITRKRHYSLFIIHYSLKLWSIHAKKAPGPNGSWRGN